MTPIIIPINHTREVNCIIEEGVRYCEKKEITKQDGAFLAFGLVFIILWFLFWGWIMIKVEDNYSFGFGLPVFVLGGFVLPALIIGIALLIY